MASVTPAHEQALEYRTAPEQADAYIGTSLGFWVTCRAAISAGEAGERAVTAGGKRRKSSEPSRPAREYLSNSGEGVRLELDPMTENEVPVMVTVEVLEMPRSVVKSSG